MKGALPKTSPLHHSPISSRRSSAAMATMIIRALKPNMLGFRASVNRRVANVTTVVQEAIQSCGELLGKKSSQPIDGSS
jgi:hypothetical protein